MLIRSYRVRGHLAAQLDPLGLDPQRNPARPDPRLPRLHRRRPRPADLARRRARLPDRQRARDRRRAARPITAATSASNICTSTTSRSAASSRTGWRARTPTISFTPEGKQSILEKVIHGEQWEKFLARKYVGTKRFGLDGGESAIPALESIIKYGGQMGVERDHHRHGPPRPPERPRQRHGQAVPRDLPRIRRRRRQPGRCRRLGRRQISPRHLVATASSTAIKVHLSLVPNPSHLEAVDPVVLGKSRAVA